MGSLSSCRPEFDTDCRGVSGSGSGISCFFGNGGGWRDSVSARSGSCGGFFTANASWVIPLMSLSTPSVHYLFAKFQFLDSVVAPVRFVDVGVLLISNYCQEPVGKSRETRH